MSHSPGSNGSAVLFFPPAPDAVPSVDIFPDRRALAALPLTPREREVLDWVAAGKTNREIAAILGTSPRTVQKHLEHVFTKLGVETRIAAVMRALSLTVRGGGFLRAAPAGQRRNGR